MFIPIHSRWLSISSIERIEFIVMTSVHCPFIKPVTCKRFAYNSLFFINDILGTTKRSLLYNSVLLYSAAAVTLANNSQSPVTNKPNSSCLIQGTFA